MDRTKILIISVSDSFCGMKGRRSNQSFNSVSELKPWLKFSPYYYYYFKKKTYFLANHPFQVVDIKRIKSKGLIHYLISNIGTQSNESDDDSISM